MGREMMDTYDVVVVGGGPAGLSGALVLSRARRSVLVVDAGEPRNAPAEAVHGFLSRDGTSPADLLGAGPHGDRRLRRRGRQRAGRLASRNPGGFTLTLSDGHAVLARRLLVTVGLVDELPQVPGVRERWGRDVLHCPYCHGWEVRDEALGVLATGPMAIHQALLLGQWSSDVTLFRHTYAEPSDSEREQLAARRVSVVDGEVAGLEVTGGRLTGVRLRAGQVMPLQALVVTPHYVARSELAASLGLETMQHPAGIGSYVAADPNTLIAGPGVWVAGNVTNLMAQVVQAAADGARAAIGINADLVTEDVQKAVTARQNPFSAESERENCERVLGERRHGLRL